MADRDDVLTSSSMNASVHTVAADSLMRDKEILAREVTTQLYKERPELLEVYGEQGRVKCLQDMRYNVEHLTPAVALGKETLFADYVTWLDGLLRARSVAREDLVRCLVLLREDITVRYDAAEAGVITHVIDAGLQVLES